MLSHIVYTNEKLRQLQAERKADPRATLKPVVCRRCAAGVTSRRLPIWWPLRRGGRNTVAVGR